jgi:hypothetical protein
VPYSTYTRRSFHKFLGVALAIFGSEPGSLLDHGSLHKTGKNRVHSDIFEAYCTAVVLVRRIIARKTKAGGSPCSGLRASSSESRRWWSDPLSYGIADHDHPIIVFDRTSDRA